MKAILAFLFLTTGAFGWPPGIDPAWPHTSAAGPATIAPDGAWKTSSNGNGSSTVTVSPVSGDTILVFIFGYSSTPSSAVSDNVNGSAHWVAVNTSGSSPLFVTAGNAHLSAWVLPKAYSAGVTLITATVSTFENPATVYVHAISGLSASPFTQGEVGTGASTAAGGTSVSTSSMSYATANSIIFGAGGVVGLGVSGFTTTGGWALYNSTNSQETNTGTYNIGSSVPYVVQSSAGSISETWTTGNTQFGSVAMIVALH